MKTMRFKNLDIYISSEEERDEGKDENKKISCSKPTKKKKGFFFCFRKLFLISYTWAILIFS